MIGFIFIVIENTRFIATHIWKVLDAPYCIGLWTRPGISASRLVHS